LELVTSHHASSVICLLGIVVGLSASFGSLLLVQELRLLGLTVLLIWPEIINKAFIEFASVSAIPLQISSLKRILDSYL